MCGGTDSCDDMIRAYRSMIFVMPDGSCAANAPTVGTAPSSSRSSASTRPMYVSHADLALPSASWNAYSEAPRM